MDEPTPPTAPLDFDPVDLRPRHDGWTLDRQRAFLEALADSGIVRHAAGEVGMSEQSVTRLRRRAGAASFDLACDAALRIGARRLRAIAFERAVEGQVKRHYYHGELVSEERVFDNRLLICLLGKHQNLYCDRPEVVKAERNWADHLATLVEEDSLIDPEAAAAEASVVIQPLGTERTGDEDFGRDDDSDEWRTGFPPPPCFRGIEEGEPGDEFYERRLTEDEEILVEVRMQQALDIDTARLDAFIAATARKTPKISLLGPEPSTPSGDRAASAPP